MIMGAFRFITSMLAIILCAFTKDTGNLVNPDCPEVFISGYQVQKLKRSEVESRVRNEKRRKQGQSFSKAIDYYEETFFIPKDSLRQNRLLSDLLNNNLNFYDRQVFFFPSDETKLYINKFCGSEIQMKTVQPASTSRYFATMVRGTNEYLYKIWYVEGQALKAEIENKQFNRRYLGLHYRLDSSLNSFDVFFIHIVNVNTGDIPVDSGLKEWIATE